MAELPAAQGFVRTVARHLYALIVARLALLESAASLGSARHVALKACESLAALLNVSKDALLLVDWLGMETLMHDLQSCTAHVSRTHTALLNIQASSVPLSCSVSESDEDAVLEELKDTAPQWKELAGFSRAAEAKDIPRSSLVRMARILSAWEPASRRISETPAERRTQKQSSAPSSGWAPATTYARRTDDEPLFVVHREVPQDHAAPQNHADVVVLAAPLPVAETPTADASTTASASASTSVSTSASTDQAALEQVLTRQADTA
jgi:hypothetical protein